MGSNRKIVIHAGEKKTFDFEAFSSFLNGNLVYLTTSNSFYKTDSL